MTTPDTAAPEARFAEVADDALSRAQRALGLMPRDGSFAIGRRIALAVGLAWLPLVVYAFWQQRLLPGGAVPEPLLEHFGIHARYLIALPLLIVAEATTRATFRELLPNFVSGGLLAGDALAAFRAILERASRLRHSRAALAVLVALVFGASWIGWRNSADFHELVWDTAPAGRSFHFGVFWFSLVSRPLFLLALLAWVWRLGVIGWALARIARLDLALVPTHPDRAGGLGFMERLPGGLLPIHLAISVPIAAHWGHEAAYHGVSVLSLKAPAAGLLIANLVLAVAPLLAFAPRLIALRRAALLRWGALLSEHGRLVERRWIGREHVEDDGLLSAPELGPVADTTALYENVRKLRPAPITAVSIVPPVLGTVIPLLPVAATQIPLAAIAKKLLAGLVGI